LALNKCFLTGIIGEISFRNYTRSERSTIARVFWLQRLGWCKFHN